MIVQKKSRKIVAALPHLRPCRCNHPLLAKNVRNGVPGALFNLSDSIYQLCGRIFLDRKQIGLPHKNSASSMISGRRRPRGSRTAVGFD